MRKIVAIFIHTTKSKVSFQPGHSKDHNEGAKMSFGEMKKKKVCNKCRRSEKSHSSPVKVSKFGKQIFQPKLLPKKEPTNLFFYPDYLSG